MKTNIQNIYSKMKPEELALISFKAISTQDSDLMDAIEATIEHKTYVGRDINYSKNLHNRVDFSVWFGLQYHCISSNLFGYYWLTEREGTDEFDELKSQAYKIQQLLLNMGNSLCDQYRIDKTTFLAIAQIKMTPDQLAATDVIDSKYMSAEIIKYTDDMAMLFNAVLNQNLGNSKNKK